MIPIESLYEEDFHLWIQRHIELLNDSNFADLDIAHLIEALNNMAKSDRRELANRLITLIAPLLKWQYQPTHRSTSWRSSIDENRVQIEVLLEDVPRLTSDFSETIKAIYQKAVKLAAKKTGLKQASFPIACPYSENQLMNEDFYPES